MAAASAYVFRGTVVSASPGRTVGESEDDQITFRTVVVRVLETAKGRATRGQELEFEEEGYEADGTGYVMNGVQWSNPGDEAWYFLREGGDGYLRLASRHGRFTLVGEHLGPSGVEPKDPGPWRETTAESVAAQIRDAVTGAQEIIGRRGKGWMLPILSLLALVLASPAAADHANTANSGDPDDGDHYMDRHDLTTAADNASIWGRDQLNRADDMNATFTGSGDVNLYDSNYGDSDWAGRVNCEGDIHWLTGNCDVFRLRYNLYYMGGDTTSHWRSLGCHELGHTAGLGHRWPDDNSNDNSCMRGDDIWPTEFDSHDINAINSSV